MWTFESRTGKLFDPSGKLVWTGYAGGNKGKNPEGVNNPDMQDVPNVGPLPEGVYTFGKLFLESHLGPYAIELVPDPANDMHGRGDFFCHGDHIGAPGTASEGCIIMPRPIRERMFKGVERQIRVVADYVPVV